MKKRFIVLVSSLTLILLVTLLSGCTSECDHKFSEEWTSDEFTHWHACTNKECKTKKDSDAHVWGDAVVTTEPTCTEYGISTRTCIVCEATMSDPIAKKMHEYKDTFDFDDNNHWRQCKNCDSRITNDHNFETPGHDTENHWYNCECGAKGSVEAHTWDEGVQNDNGTITYTCTNALCKAPLTTPDLNHEHKWVDGQVIKQPSCISTGIQERLCGCGAVSEKTLDKTSHSFTFGDYQKDDSYHWRKCECGTSPSEADKTPHDFGTEYTIVGEYKVYTCVCGQEKKEIQSGYIDPDGWT